MTSYTDANVATEEVSDICAYVPIITPTKSGLPRLYGMTACSSSKVLPTPLHPAMRDEFAAWDRASDEGFMGFERVL